MTKLLLDQSIILVRNMHPFLRGSLCTVATAGDVIFLAFFRPCEEKRGVLAPISFGNVRERLIDCRKRPPAKKH